MPIKPENKALYPKDWKVIRARILKRADDKCERCRAPNGKLIARGVASCAGTYMLWDGETYCEQTGEYLRMSRGSEYCTKGVIQVVLTIAHMDRALVDHSDENLKALCQKCHLAHDRPQHIESRRRTAKNKKASGDLLERA